MNFDIIHIEETDSTNRWLKECHKGVDPIVAWAEYQTAGKGCGSNSWESERGKNLTFSLLIHPEEIPANEQFRITEITSVALCETLERYLDEKAGIKWPNDIYVGDKKICGMLIENQLQGSKIKSCIIGIGLNVNQQQFLSDAPNPVSLRGITGKEHDLDTLLRQVCSRIDALAADLGNDDVRNDLHRRYLAALYRNDDAMHPFADAAGNRFMASIHGIAPDGTLTLLHEDGTCHDYLFKEVRHIINNISF